jgi:hypothetical protein
MVGEELRAFSKNNAAVLMSLHHWKPIRRAGPVEIGA